MRSAGWLWIEEYIWHKRNCAPGKWPNRFRDAWERCLHFALDRDFAMYQDEVMFPMGDWAETRSSNLSEIDYIRDPSASGSPFAKNVSKLAWSRVGPPDQRTTIRYECGYVGHSASFPEEVPEFFIRLFTRTGDLVCDPFVGSGTTGIVCARLNRKFIGIDILEQNIRLAEGRIWEAMLGGVAE
jgi:site-specific DNA-methyltransferase (adenine-specific)/site-specific DNA-methyltransferase (cytosine-N4-specific)